MKTVGPDFNKILSKSLRVFFKDALRSALSNPSQAVFFLKTLNWQKRAAKIRENWERQGIHVPPILVFSVTSRCNLHCKGCYHQTLRPTSEADISDERLRRAIAEAKEPGISFIVLGAISSPIRLNVSSALSSSGPSLPFTMTDPPGFAMVKPRPFSYARAVLLPMLGIGYLSFEEI